MIEFKNVSKTFSDGTEAVSDISFKVNKGELLTLIGPSGCGKTTTMKMINRLIEPTAGDIYIQDKKVKTFNVHELRWNIGYVLQEIALFPHLTVAENIAVVPEMKKWKKNDISKRTKELLNMVGLDADTYARKMPSELSGGEQQRVGVIRALAADPDIILMDEPFSALDPISREQLQQDIRELQTKIHKTIVFVTHDIDEALALGDRVCLMQEGSIVQIDEPQILVTHPANEFVDHFIGSRKSPWQSAVDVIADTSGKRVVLEKDLGTNDTYQSGVWVVVDDSNTFKHVRADGTEVDIEPITNYMPLEKAAHIVEANAYDLVPVTKKGRLVGTLSNRDIVRFLQAHANQGNGVTAIG
ncbi:Beta-(1--_2)glucan export ATP-binding/permease protein NdvA [Lentibacillus sp. JNUCC-1]|uniref:ABC transporter ATP-binding protein n=1 Tax=Lentibacillus sp. JNUCC-1 TaxID=2654513 RepID=UPI0012E7137A|nr:ABC transporter ATP-binding protein [Lentibacillus sp. JNUCC-1]MUV36758.1 Beta-(1-->2)glucan export ATP-binding/permease protein NdvA [Lentibacillus sp. JNUCC-1]